MDGGELEKGFKIHLNTYNIPRSAIINLGDEGCERSKRTQALLAPCLYSRQRVRTVPSPENVSPTGQRRFVKQDSANHSSYRCFTRVRYTCTQRTQRRPVDGLADRVGSLCRRLNTSGYGNECAPRARYCELRYRSNRNRLPDMLLGSKGRAEKRT